MIEISMVVHSCNPSLHKVEARESKVQGQPGYIERPYLKKK
jgi:hypothetical protein